LVIVAVMRSASIQVGLYRLVYTGWSIQVGLYRGVLFSYVDACVYGTEVCRLFGLIGAVLWRLCGRRYVVISR